MRLRLAVRDNGPVVAAVRCFVYPAAGMTAELLDKPQGWIAYVLGHFLIGPLSRFMQTQRQKIQVH